MAEKLSEMPVRQEKVNQLKTKLIGEASEKLNHYFEVLHENKFDAVDECAKRIITRMHNLYELQAFLNWDNAFMYIHNVYEDLDKIVYALNSDTLDWMLQEEHLLPHILFAIEKSETPGEAVLSDNFFQYEVFSVFDKIEWDKKKEELVNKNDEKKQTVPTKEDMSK